LVETVEVKHIGWAMSCVEVNWLPAATGKNRLANHNESTNTKPQIKAAHHMFCLSLQSPMHPSQDVPHYVHWSRTAGLWTRLHQSLDLYRNSVTWGCNL